MLELNKRKSIDLLIEQFWKNGYMTVSRKYGTYLPEPEKVGGFEVDIIARHNKNYAIGITVSADDMKDPELLNRIKFLSTRETKFSHNKVMLFIGTSNEHFKQLTALVESLEGDFRSNIRVFRISDDAQLSDRSPRRKKRPLFS